MRSSLTYEQRLALDNRAMTGSRAAHRLAVEIIYASHGGCPLPACPEGWSEKRYSAFVMHVLKHSGQFGDGDPLPL